MTEIVTPEMVAQAHMAGVNAFWTAPPEVRGEFITRAILNAVAPLIRRAALEEAAQVAEDAALCVSDGDGAHTELKALAVAIRALAEKQP